MMMPLTGHGSGISSSAGMAHVAKSGIVRAP
jgi:hypothetical protein